ncbi:NADH-quinone oxidoreductase subunit NuoH [Desulfobacterota bacterium AH_259_B03_O07]|nr:NADH-quinone oxidoreductase subunit NuoH [Desulfobacterota bacterium AH_259_B03_O07]
MIYIQGLVQSAILLGAILGIVAYLTWLERKFSGRLQSRVGPYLVGRPHGWLQPIADGLKLISKEDITPSRADRLLFNLAPAWIVVVSLLGFAFLPLTANWVLVNMDLGLLYFTAIGSLLVIGVFAAGWASNNKYALLSSLRSAAQIVAYEVPLLLSLLVPAILAGSLDFKDIIEAQESYWFITFPVIGQISFLIFLLAALAESNKMPFDLSEAESELIAGFNIEYSGMKFAYFYLGEYAHLMAVSLLVSIVFFGGPLGPLLPGGLWIAIKTLAVFLGILWIRWSFLRIRIDQLMMLNWKILTPISFINLLLAGLWVSLNL